MTPQSIWDTTKAVLRGKFIAMSVNVEKTERSSQINDLMLKLIEQAKPKKSRRREIIKIRAKIHEIKNINTIQRTK
jgi:hypothetical protein